MSTVLHRDLYYVGEMNMRISFFIGSMIRGGAERVISLLANHYCHLDWEVDIVLLLVNQVEYDLDDRINVVDLTLGNNSYARKALGWLSSIREYLKERRPNRVVSFVARINALVLTAALGLKIPVIVSERNDPRRDGRGFVMQAYCNLIYHMAERVVYQTSYEKTCFSRTLEHKGVIIVNPVSVAMKKQPADNPFRIVTAGRLAEQKNHIMLIRAVEKVLEKGRKVVCDIYGEGPYRETTENEIRKCGVQDIVTLWGNVKDIHQRLSKASLFVMTSNYEGLSNALIEAMMMGLPCITTDYDGANELILDGDNGLVVARNDFQGLADAILRVMEEDGLAYRLGVNAEKSAEVYKSENVLAQWEKVIG